MAGNEDMTLPMGLTVWCAGTGPVPLIETLLQQLPPEARHRDGHVNVDRWLRPPMPSEHLKGSIFVLGDAAAFSDKGLEPSRILNCRKPPKWLDNRVPFWHASLIVDTI